MPTLPQLVADGLAPVPGYVRVLVVPRAQEREALEAVAGAGLADAVTVVASPTLDQGQAYTWQKPAPTGG